MAESVDLARIIVGCRKGDSQCFSQLVDMYASRCYGYFYRLTGNNDISDELLSELFVKLVEKISTYKGGSFEGWLFRIASNIFHDFLRKYAGLSEKKRSLIKIGWIMAVTWFLFAIGPFCVIGNSIFGDPLAPKTWFLGMPSIWLWQILWWLLGIYMMYFLAYKLEMSTHIEKDFEALKHDIYETAETVSAE